MNVSAERLADTLNRAQEILDYFDAEANEALAGETERGDLWSDIEIPVADLRTLTAAAKVRAIREGDGEVAAEIEGLIDAYWGLAFTEGSEGRTTDTPDGAAQDTRAAISRRLAALAASPIPATGGEKE